jgi:hypothetical protein
MEPILAGQGTDSREGKTDLTALQSKCKRPSYFPVNDAYFVRQPGQAYIALQLFGAVERPARSAFSMASRSDSPEHSKAVVLSALLRFSRKIQLSNVLRWIDL